MFKGVSMDDEFDEEMCQGQNPDYEEDEAFRHNQPQGDEDDEGADMEQDEIPTEPDIEWYLSLYDITDSQKVAMCRTFASYLVAKGKSGVKARGPPSRLQRQERVEFYED